MLPGMDPSSKHETANLLVIRPVRIIGVALAIVDTGEDAAHFATIVEDAGGGGAVAFGEINFSSGGGKMKIRKENR